MNPLQRGWASCALTLAMLLVGCGDRDNHARANRNADSAHAGHDDHGHDDHGHDDHGHADHGHGDHGDHAEAQDAPARFKEGQGLWLADATARALGVETSEVEERMVSRHHEITASVFDAGPPVRASALVPIEVARELEKHPPTEPRLLTVRRDLANALQQAEAVFALPDSHAVGSTVTFTLAAEARTGTAIPRGALLRTAAGSFVYVVNGTHLLRTPVQAGGNDGAFIEIVEGLYAGDVVVTAAVEQLWLTELRLTKGGGHSH